MTTSSGAESRVNSSGHQASSESAVPGAVEQHYRDMSPGEQSQRIMNLPSSAVLQYKMFKLKQPVYNQVYKMIAEDQVSFKQKRAYKTKKQVQKTTSGNEISPKSPSISSKTAIKITGGTFWNMYLLEVLRNNEIQTRQTPRINTCRSDEADRANNDEVYPPCTDTSPQAKASHEQPLKENIDMQQGQSVHVETNETPREICVSASGHFYWIPSK